MGLLLSRFRKKKTTIEILEDLEKKIKKIEEFGQDTEQRHKKIVGTLIVYSVALYIIAALIFYFYFFPAALYDQIFYMTPLLIFPILILFTKKLVTWYYKRKISRNKTKLSTMEQEKKKILEDVTETETYKKAKEILMRFAPDQLRMTPLTPNKKVASPNETTPRRPSTPQTVLPPLPGGGVGELRRRALTVSNVPANKQTGRPVSTGLVPIGVAPMHSPSMVSPYLQQPTSARSSNSPGTGMRSPLPRPILAQQRSYLDRLVEYLVGDGPSNRYALICRQCESHNGMALKEEFEYFGFRCCYCNFWNPARKQKPSAPRLEHDTSGAVSLNPSPLAGQLQQKFDDTMSNTSDTEENPPESRKEIEKFLKSYSDIEVVEKPDNVDSGSEDKSGNEKEEAAPITSETTEIDQISEEKETKEEPLTELDSEHMEVDESPSK